ncbi:MAG: hypothetical protein PHW15_03505 [Patescibacteria group bacterium]|nr:hypothetical protein [Patescibacteria group bacterium]
MNYTKKYEQVSNAAARAKFKRMASGVGRTGVTCFEAWFSTWWLGNDDDFSDYPGEENKHLAIYVSSNYHPVCQLDIMYKKNCKTF